MRNLGIILIVYRIEFFKVMENQKTKIPSIPQRIINSLLTDVKLGGMNFRQVALFLYHKGWTKRLVTNYEVVNILYGNFDNYLKQ